VKQESPLNDESMTCYLLSKSGHLFPKYHNISCHSQSKQLGGHGQQR